MLISLENSKNRNKLLWKQVIILPSKKSTLQKIVKKIVSQKKRYEIVEKDTGIPWWFVGIIHIRESSGNFSTFLGNGEPLNKITKLVPRGLGPWNTWEDGAIAALHLKKLEQIKNWDIPTALYYFEAFNGFGYSARGVPSPYVWSFTNIYTHGKYTADGKYSASTIDKQPGCAAMLLQLLLLNLIPTLAKEVIPMAIDAVNNVVNPAPANTSAGVTVNKSQNLATHAIVFIGAMISALGLSQVHSIYEAVVSSQVFGGLIISVLAMLISHLTVNGSNDNTLDLIDKILVSLTPASTQLVGDIATPVAPNPTQAAS